MSPMLLPEARASKLPCQAEPDKAQSTSSSINTATKHSRQPKQPHQHLATMSGIGAELPPHLLAKRKRQQEEETPNEPTTTSGAKRSPSPDSSEKRRKVAGPAMPPAPLEERPTEPAEQNEQDDESSSDDDDFGPSLPPTGGVPAPNPTTSRPQPESDESTSQEKPRRDDWMTMPPEQDGLASRMDPSKIRARGFNTGKGAKAPAEKGGDNSSWHETPEQKRKRLEDEMMGVSRPSPGAAKTVGPSKKQVDDAATRELKERTVSSLKASMSSTPKLTNQRRKNPEAPP